MWGPIVFLALWLGSACGQSPVESEGRGAVVGYSSNIEAFPFYRCRFKLTFGTAKSEADAKAAKGAPGDSAEALAIKDGEKDVLEVFGATRLPPPTAAEQKKAGKGGTTYVVFNGYEAEKYFRNGKASGGYDAMMQSLNVHKREDGPPPPSPGKTYCPLYTWYGDQGVRGPDRMLAQPDKYSPTFLGERTAGGRRVVGVRFVGQRYQDGSAVESESWLDPDRGYLPVEYRTRSKDSDPFRTGTITEVKEFRPGRFFPMRLVEWWENATPGQWGYQEVKVLELNVDDRPTSKDLSVILPAGTAVSAPDRGGYFKLKQDERLSPDDLDELFEKLERSKTNPRMDTAIEHTAERKGWLVWAAAGVGAAFLLSGAFLWWRKRRLARRGSP